VVRRPIPGSATSAGRRRWRRRGDGGGGDLPPGTFDGSESIPSPYADPERNSVERLIIVSRTVLDPSRLSNRRYQRRIGLVAALHFVVDAAFIGRLGAPWFARGLVLIGAAVYVAVRFRRPVARLLGDPGPRVAVRAPSRRVQRQRRHHPGGHLPVDEYR
jgi:hypothetical protein